MLNVIPSSRSQIGESAEDLAEFLRQETTGGRLLLLATAVALIWANVAPDLYESFWQTTAAVGPAWLHLDLTLGDWAADGLLAIFFFVAGLEVKRELLAGELADRRAAALPVFAALGGMVVPALVAIVVSLGAALEGGAWAIPVATDIAFALGVLALVGTALPAGVRVLLLAIAVIDDLLAIALIAVVFTDGVMVAWLAAALLLGAVYRLAFRHRLDRAWVLLPLAVAVWICVHASGVHATVAGILLGLLTPVGARADERLSPAERLEHRVHPVSAGVAVPLFALAAAGISLAAAGDAVNDRVAVGVFFGLLIGKVLGILGGARLAVRLGAGALPGDVRWGDVVPVAMLGAVGYTVSLLMSRLAFADPAAAERSAAAVLAASALSAALAVVLLRRRANRRRTCSGIGH